MAREELQSTRLDRWMFAVRIFRTRNLAAKAIAAGKVKIGGENVKAHRLVRVGDEIDVRFEGRTVRYQVLALLEKRVGAPEARACYAATEDPDVEPEVREMLHLYREIDRKRLPRGKPSKKDRRLLRQMKES